MSEIPFKVKNYSKDLEIFSNSGRLILSPCFFVFFIFLHCGKITTTTLFFYEMSFTSTLNVLVMIFFPPKFLTRSQCKETHADQVIRL